MTKYYIKKTFNLILAFVVIAVSTITTSVPSFATNFSDIENHWAKSYIEVISNYNAVSGYPDGSFKPNDTIKRIEFIAIIVNSQGYGIRNRSEDEYWGLPYIETALSTGLIVSNEYGNLDAQTFDENISREEMASIVVNAYLKSGGTVEPSTLDEASSKLNDLGAVELGYYSKALAAVALDFISGYPDGTFSPKRFATRAEAAIISHKLLTKLGFLSNEGLPENIILSKNTLIQGDLLKITVYHTSDLSIDQNVYPDFKWYDAGSVIEGYIPTNYSTSPGVYNLTFTNNETGSTSTRAIEVVQRKFKVQNLTVDTSVESSTRTDDAYTEYYKYTLLVTSLPQLSITQSHFYYRLKAELLLNLERHVTSTVHLRITDMLV